MIEYCLARDHYGSFEHYYQEWNQVIAMEALAQALMAVSSPSEKLAVLENCPNVKNFLNSSLVLKALVGELTTLEQFSVKALLAIGQGPVVFQDFDSVENPKERLKILVQQLLEIEKFYSGRGGIVGYHSIVLQLLHNKKPGAAQGKVALKMPPGHDISKESKERNEAVRWGIHSMRQMGELYPVGGAGDRLNLRDPDTGEPLPTAQLLFCGRTLFELLIRDVQAREFLHFKLFDEQLLTPLGVMTSHEKNNHQHILEICESNHWFARPEESFRFFVQPLVPVLTTEGDWAISNPMELILKPGGHGVIWKAAYDEGVLDWFEEQGRKKLIIRQINNPMAGIDAGLLALSGIGCKEDKDFGFASCPREVSASEGMDVLREEKKGDVYEYCITNIEYTEFKQYGLEDAPEHPGSPYSRFPANTNVLFGDVAAIKKAVNICAIPGMIVNPKSRVNCYSPKGEILKHGGRLESTMQNIADSIVNQFPYPISKEQALDLKTFLTYNERKKTISVTKQSYTDENPLYDTPESCFYDLLNNYRDLLINYCGMKLPLKQNVRDYLEKGPECVILFHPSLGPLYSVIGQKIRGGTMAKGSEWIMEIAEADIADLDLDGSLMIEADSVMGKIGAAGVLVFDNDYCGKCTLVNVKIRNQGRNAVSGRNAWRCETQRKEALRISLYGNSEFFAENVELEGDIHFEVPDGQRLVVYQQGEEIAWHFEKIKQATWKWQYSFNEDAKIVLKRVDHL